MFIKHAFLLLFAAKLILAFELSVIHLNDFHARYEETSLSSSTCKEDNCIGGFARVYTMFNELKSRPNAVLLNAGDNFQGTLYYNMFKWNITQYFMNMIPFDAITLGNHEFDNKIEGVVPFIEHLNAPTIVCNIDASLEPDFENIFKKSVVITREGKKIGIIGVMVKTTPEIAQTEELIFLDEIESINAEAERLVAEEDVFTIIILSHSGYFVDQTIAAKAHKKISLIVGGHSHSFLYTGTPPTEDPVEGPYPTIVESENSNTVLIVQALAYTKYLGNISLFYDDDTGDLYYWEGAPIYLEHSIVPDPEVVEKMQPYTDAVNEFGNTILGTTLTDLSHEGCYTEECTLGNFVTDAMVAAWRDYEGKEPDAWAYVTIATMNAGGLRAVIETGNITYNDVVTAQPFENTFDVGEIQGKYIKEFIESGTKPYRTERAYSTIYLCQFSGIKVVIDLTQPFGSRITKLDVLCQNCPEPVYEPLDEEKIYRIVVPSFLRSGGDNFVALSDNIFNVILGPVDVDHYREYIPIASPLNYTVEGRIVIIGGEDIPKMNWKP